MSRLCHIGLAGILLVWGTRPAAGAAAALNWPEIDRAAAAASSLFLDTAQRVDAVRTFVELVKVKGVSGKEQDIREAVRRRLAQAGARPVAGLDGDHNAPANLVMEPPGAGALPGRPPILLNAHLDTINESTPEFLAFDGASGDFFHLREDSSSGSSSFGGDDRSVVGVIVEAIRCLHTRYWAKGLTHHRVVLVLTADEERGCVGAKYLARKHPALFSAVQVTLTMDGPLDYRSDYPRESFVAVVSASDARAAPYQRVIELMDQLCRRRGLEFGQTDIGLGMGDFAHFPESARAGLHLRSPVRGLHRRERVNVQDLINHIDLVCFLLLGWDADPPAALTVEALGRNQVDKPR